MRSAAVIRAGLALAAFLSVGTTAVLGAACGTSSVTTKCDVSNCKGCCGADGTCHLVAAQNPQICGTAGAACTACAQNNVCASGKCELPGASCGGRGAPCCTTGSGCLTGLFCNGGTCGTTPPPGEGGGNVPVGAACLNDGACSGGVCKQVGFKDGYCTKNCQVNGDCPSGSVCGNDPGDSSGFSRICLKSCPTLGTACARTDYACDKRLSFDASPACIPKCASGATCSPATRCDGRGMCCGAVGFACCSDGTACDTGNECKNGFCELAASAKTATGGACTANNTCAGGLCMIQNACGATTCWPGGYCSSSCSGPNQCGPEAGCAKFTLNSQDIGRCLDKCPAPGGTTNQGQSDCRAGYVCDRGWASYEGSANPYVCWYRCVHSNDCAAPGVECQDGYCCGRISFACCGGKGGRCTSGTCNQEGYCA